VFPGEHPAAMQHGGGCGVTPTILLASITLVVANLLRWAAALWAVHRKQKRKGERRKAEHFDGRKNVRRGRVKRRCRESRTVDRDRSLLSSVKRTGRRKYAAAVHPVEWIVRKRRRENHSAVDEVQWTKALWRTQWCGERALARTFLTRKSYPRLYPLLYGIVVLNWRKNADDPIRDILNDAVGRTRTMSVRREASSRLCLLYYYTSACRMRWLNEKKLLSVLKGPLSRFSYDEAP